MEGKEGRKGGKKTSLKALIQLHGRPGILRAGRVSNWHVTRKQLSL